MHAAHEEAAEGVGATFPVLTTALDTYDAVTAIAQIQPSIRPTSKAKIQEAKVGLGQFPRPGCQGRCVLVYPLCLWGCPASPAAGVGGCLPARRRPYHGPG